MLKRLLKFILSLMIVCSVLIVFDIEATEENSLVIIAVAAFLPLLFRSAKKLFRKKQSPRTSQPLAVSAPPRATGASGYVMLGAKACLAAKDYVVLDVETTGFSSETDRIIEVGLIKCLDDKPVDSFTTFVNPDMHIPSNISRLTGITDADVKNAPQFKNIAAQLMAFIGDLPIVAHNGSFDARMLCSELNFLGRNYSLKVIDTLPMARKAFPDFKNHKLRTLIRELDLADYEQQHRALDDARIGHLLYLRCKEELKR